MDHLLFLLIGLIVGAALFWAVGGHRGPAPISGWRNTRASERADEDARRRTSLLDDVLEHLDGGVVVFDEMLRPTLRNQASRRLLGDGPAPPPEVLAIVRRAATDAVQVDETISLWIDERASVRVTAFPLSRGRGVVVNLRDVSEEQQSQNLRKQFVAHASHELKTPVATIQTLGEAVAEAAAEDPDAVRRFTSRLLIETDRLSRLITDLLDLSRLEDPATYSGRPVDLDQVVTEQVNALEELAGERGVTLRSSITPVQVRGDAAQLGLMVRNLLDNGIRYTPSGGRVSVEVRADATQARLVVADTGVGIPLRDRGRVFERFYRVDAGRARATGGTGLGLAIVKHVCESHGGRVELESDYGEGSTFVVHLPVAASAPFAVERSA